jgi:hypothetical protein
MSCAHILRDFSQRNYGRNGSAGCRCRFRKALRFSFHLRPARALDAPGTTSSSPRASSSPQRSLMQVSRSGRISACPPALPPSRSIAIVASRSAIQSARAEPAVRLPTLLGNTKQRLRKTEQRAALRDRAMKRAVGERRCHEDGDTDGSRRLSEHNHALWISTERCNVAQTFRGKTDGFGARGGGQLAALLGCSRQSMGHPQQKTSNGKCATISLQSCITGGSSLVVVFDARTVLNLSQACVEPVAGSRR